MCVFVRAENFLYLLSHDIGGKYLFTYNVLLVVAVVVVVVGSILFIILIFSVLFHVILRIQNKFPESSVFVFLVYTF